MRGRQIAMALAALCLVSGLLVLAPLPAGTRAAIVLPVALVAPGVAVTRTLGVRDRLLEVVLAFPISAALCVLVAQTLLYLHLWAPRGGLTVLLAGSGALLWRYSQTPEDPELLGDRATP